MAEIESSSWVAYVVHLLNSVFVENVMSGDNGKDRKILPYCFVENCGKLFNVRM